MTVDDEEIIRVQIDEVRITNGVRPA